MTHQNEEFIIVQGPSKLDLMLSLLDTEMGLRIVRFQVVCEADPTRKTEWADVQIVSVRRQCSTAKIWNIEGTLETQSGEKWASIYYLSDTRNGKMKIEYESRTENALKMLSDTRKKVETFMTIIQKMITIVEYLKTKGDNLNGNMGEEISKLFEKAKWVYAAEDDDTLTKVIKDI